MKVQTKLIRPIAFMGLCLLLSACGASNSAMQNTVTEKIVYVNVENAEIRSIKNEMAYPGQVKANEQIAVMSKISGKVDEVFAQMGDFVKEGDVLFTMESTDMENNIKSLEAQLATAEAGVRSAETGVSLVNGSSMQSQLLQAAGGVEQAYNSLKTAEKNAEQALLAIEQREMALEQAQLSYNEAEKNYTDATVLFSAGAMSKSQMDQFETLYSNAKIGLDQAKSALEQAKNSYSISTLSVTQSQVAYDQAVESQKILSNQTPAENLKKAKDALEQAIASRNSLMVNLETAREKLDDISIKSPITGTVSSRNIEPKTMLSATSVPFTIVSSDTVEVKVNVTEAIVNKLKVGQKVNVSVSAASDEPFVGNIVTLSPAANEATSAFEVRIALDNKSGIIKPGMYAEVSFIKAQADDSVVIPRSAVVTENSVPVVYTVEGDIVKVKEVQTGIDNGMEIEIVSGLTPGDLVVVKGQNYINDGTRVKIVESRGESK